MPKNHSGLHKRLVTGAKGRKYRKKKKFESGSDPVETLTGKRAIQIRKTKGGNTKIKLANDDFVNVRTISDGKIIKKKILNVKSNPSNKHYERRGVITKGAIIVIDSGQAKVTSRPGQDGIINAIEIET